MAVPTLGTLVQASGTSGTINWNVTAGTAGVVGLMYRDSQWLDDDGTLGGVAATNVPDAYASGLSGMAIAGNAYEFLGESGTARSAYSQWGDHRHFFDFPINGTGVTYVDGGHYDWSGAGTGNKNASPQLNPNGNDCVLILAAIIEVSGWGADTPSSDVGLSFTQVHSGDIMANRFCRIYKADWPASLGAGTVGMNQSRQYHDFIVLAALFGSPAAGPLGKYGMSVVGS